MTTTDFRVLCAELIDQLKQSAEVHWNYGCNKAARQCDAVVERARAALAEPEPEGPTLDDIWELCEEHGFVLGIDGAHEDESAEGLLSIARAVLARWGTPNLAETRSSLGDAPQPVPVSERLPRPDDCDAEGKCWWGRSESNDWSADWTLATHEAVAEFCEFSPQTVWLPAHALPIPTTSD